MLKLDQTAFEKPERLDSVKDEPLVIHARPATNNRVLVILVHGLGGSRYGENSTWGDMPKYIFEDSPHVDVGLYSYRTLLGRLRFSRSISLPVEGKVFSGIICDLKQYTTIILIGHSMGGLLCMSAVCALIDDRLPLTQLGGLILMATPTTGSLRVPRLLSFLSKDFYALRPHGEFVQRIHDTFSNHLALDEADVRHDKTLLPTWVILSASDFWVDPLSAGFSLPGRRKRWVREPHTRIVKPTREKSDRYEWISEAYKIVHNAVEICLEKSESTDKDLPTDEQRRISTIVRMTQHLAAMAEDMTSKLHLWVMENQKILNQWRRANNRRAVIAKQMRELYEDSRSRDQVARWSSSAQETARQLALTFADNSDISAIADQLREVIERLRKIMYSGECVYEQGGMLTKLMVVDTMESKGTRAQVNRVVDAYLSELNSMDEQVAELVGRLNVIKQAQASAVVEGARKVT